jgi:Protein of unknown function (DUF3168)
MTAKACQDALDEAFKADANVADALGSPVRLYDAPVKMGAMPFGVWRRWETRNVDTSGVPTQEHTATIEVISKQTGTSEARAALIALSQRANGIVPSAIGAKNVLILPVYTDVLRSVDGRTWLGILRLKIIAEPI